MMLTIEMQFKVRGRVVSLEGLAADFADKLAKELGTGLEHQLTRLRPVTVPIEVPSRHEEKRREPKAVGVNEAARMLGLSHYTLRTYIAQGRIHAIRVGRRILVPMETIEQIAREDIPRQGGLD